MDEKKRAQELIDTINACLQVHTSESVKKLLEIVFAGEIQEHYATVRKELVYAHLLADITYQEIQEYGNAVFLLNGHAIEEFIKVIKLFQFRIWELEFLDDAESEERFYLMYQLHAMTPVTLRAITDTATVDRGLCYCRIIVLFGEKGEWEVVKYFIRYGKECFKDNPEVLGYLAALDSGLGGVAG